MAKVDIIIPFFNTPLRYVKTMLNSVLAQTYRDWRAVVVNDGSSEASAAEVESLVGTYRDSRLVYLNAPHRGLPAARNAGISLSDAPYVALLDSDDAWYPQKLEVQVGLLDREPDVGVVYANCEVIDSEDQPVCVGRRLSQMNRLTREQLFIEMCRQNFVPVVTAVLRRREGRAVGFFNDNLLCLEDKELWLRIIHRGSSFKYQDEVLARYRVHATNMSKKIENMKQGRFQVIEIARALASDGTLKQINWPKVEREMVRHAYVEAAEGYLEQKQYLQALKLSSPRYCGPTGKACVLMARTLWNCLRSHRPWIASPRVELKP